MSSFVSVIFCRNCSSRYVEIVEWENHEAAFHCRTCGFTELMKGFTLGRCSVSEKELQTAHDTRALKGRPER